MDCYCHIFAHSDNQEKNENRSKPLHNLQVFRVSLLEKMPILRAFEGTEIEESKSKDCIQLNLFEI